jgi:hypothetical protein
MSVYLPYCDEFISDDWDQQKCLLNRISNLLSKHPSSKELTKIETCGPADSPFGVS